MSLEEIKDKHTPVGAMLEKEKRGLIRTDRERSQLMLWRKIVELTEREDVESLDAMRDALETEGIGKDATGTILYWPTSRKALDKLFRRVWGTDAAHEKIRDMKERKKHHQKYQKYFDLTHELEVGDSFAKDYVTGADAFELKKDVATRQLSGEIMPVVTTKQDTHSGYRKITYTRRGDFGAELNTGKYDFSAKYMVRRELHRALKRDLEIQFDVRTEEKLREEMKKLNLPAEISDDELAKRHKQMKRRVKAEVKHAFFEPEMAKLNNRIDEYMAKVATGDRKSWYVHNVPLVDLQLDPAYASKDKRDRGSQRMVALPGRYWSRATLNIPFLHNTPPKRVQISSHAIAKNQGPFRLIKPESPAYRAEFNDLEGFNARVRLPKDPRENLMTAESGALVTKDFADRGSYIYISPVKELIVEDLGDLRDAARMDDPFTPNMSGEERDKKLRELGERKESFIRRGDMLVRHAFENFGRVQYAADHSGMLVYVGSPAKKDDTQYYRTLDEGEPYQGCTMAPQPGKAGATVLVKGTKKGRRADLVEEGGRQVCGEEIGTQTQTVDGKSVVTHYCPVHGNISDDDVAEFHKPRTVFYYRQKYQIIRKSPLKIGDKLFNRNGMKSVIADVVPDLGKDEKGRPYDLVVNGEDIWGEGPQALKKGKQKAGIVLERRASNGTIFVFLDGEFSADTPFTPRSGLSISSSFIGGLLEKKINADEFDKAYQQGTLLPDIFKALHLRAIRDAKTGKVTVEPDPENPRPDTIKGYTLRTDPNILRMTHTVNNIKYKYMYVPPWIARKYFSQGSIRENTMTYKKLFEQVMNRFDLLPKYSQALNLKAVPWVPPTLTDDTKIIMDVSDMMLLGYDPRSAMPFKVTIRKEPVSIAASIQTYTVVPDGTGRYKNCLGIHPLLATKGIIDFDGDEIVAFTPAIDEFVVKLTDKDKEGLRSYEKYDWKDMEKKSEQLHLTDDELAFQCAKWNQEQFANDQYIYKLGGLRKRYTLSRGDNPVTLKVLGVDTEFNQERVNDICNVEGVMKQNIAFAEVGRKARQVIGQKGKNTLAQQKAEMEKIRAEDPTTYKLVKQELERMELDRYLKHEKTPYYDLFRDPDDIIGSEKWEGYLQFEHGRKFKFVLDPAKRVVDRFVVAQIQNDKDIFIER